MRWPRVWRLRHPLLRRLPATFSEIGVVACYGTLSLLLAMLVWLVLAVPFLALTTLCHRYALEQVDALPLVGDLDAGRDAAVDGFRMFVNRP